MATEIDMKALLEAGAHFGHKTSRWHPKMAPYIHSKRQEAHIINLEKTVDGLEKALAFSGMPYVTVRWVGGTLTNTETVNRQIRKLKDLEKKMASGELESRYSKLEVQRFQEEIDTLNERYGGIKDMTEQPAAVLITDANEDKNAVKEAKALNIPVIAICDTNVDPTGIKYVIPMNDDSTKAEKLVLDYFVETIKKAKK